MPSKPTWFHRLPEILDALCGMDATHLDRQAVETLFGVGPRRGGRGPRVRPERVPAASAAFV